MGKVVASLPADLGAKYRVQSLLHLRLAGGHAHHRSASFRRWLPNMILLPNDAPTPQPSRLSDYLTRDRSAL
jgi:hypothetical protein